MCMQPATKSQPLSIHGYYSMAYYCLQIPQLLIHLIIMNACFACICPCTTFMIVKEKRGSWILWK